MLDIRQNYWMQHFRKLFLSYMIGKYAVKLLHISSDIQQVDPDNPPVTFVEVLRAAECEPVRNNPS
jgi:hypothetical protein